MLDARDRECRSVVGAGLDDELASARLGLESGGLDFYVAAVRECFEESGLLFATDASGSLATLAETAPGSAAIAACRGPLHRGDLRLEDVCRECGLRLAVDRLVYFGHWLTPVGRPKRFDTRFFLAEAPAGQVATPDDAETLEQRWFAPADALAQSARLKLVTPTVKTLEAIARFETVPALFAWASAPRLIVPSMPHMGVGRQGCARSRPTSRRGPNCVASTPRAARPAATRSCRTCRCAFRRA